MTDSEYECLQDGLSQLLTDERLNHKFPHGNYRDAYKSAVMDCKSKLHEIHNTRKQLSRRQKS